MYFTYFTFFKDCYIYLLYFQLASIRGHGKFILLKDQDLDRLHQIASGNNETVDAVAMQFLVDNEKDVPEEQSNVVQKFIKSANTSWAVS